MPGQEQFRRAISEIRNLHIVAALGPLFDFRSEIVSNDEFGVRGGLDDTTKEHYVEHLLAADRMRRRVTYNPERAPLGDLIERATSSQETLLGSTAPFGGDEVQEAPGGLIALPWALDGSDPNIPLSSQLNFRSQNALILLGALDRAIVNWTRLESRFRSTFIYVKDSMRMYGSYVQTLEYLKAFAGDANRVDMAAGVRPTEEPLGPTDSPNLRSETASGTAARG
ncbi:hypothetical protein [Adhaeretor mobilis]|uniref:Uncharacterized protein n=1 Tax=Adhaeretor mobilis TaxID=1930276 RepID=A0A517N2D2_9BACT|nr:hypothetical protein [Adhaeretor mobilis]QDT01283.1 hypothetical protein HG15A2_46250 [Adhaeretor mobilis]